MLLSGLQIPQLSSLVHGSGGAETLMRVESHSYDLILMPSKGIEQFASIRIPQFGCRIETTSDYLIAK